MQRRQIARVVAVPGSIPGRPSGDATHVFEMFVYLSDGARLNTALPPGQSYRARRLVDGAEVWSGRMVGEGLSWVLQSDDDDDPIWFIEFGALRPGEYITLYPPGRSELMFHIVTVDYPSVTPDVSAAEMPRRDTSQRGATRRGPSRTGCRSAARPD